MRHLEVPKLVPLLVCFFPNRRSLKGSNAIIQLGYFSSTAPGGSCDSGFRNPPGFRRVPDKEFRRVPQVSGSHEFPRASEGSKDS